jgi:hypothetical protein
MNFAAKLLSLALAAAFSTLPAWSQAAPKPDAPTPKPVPDTAAPRPVLHCDATTFTERTFYLNNSVQSSDANELVTALRNMLEPCDKVYLVANQSAIVMEAPTEQMALVQKLITDLDRPKRTYRLTYTVTEMDNDKKIGTQHFAMVVASGQETQLKQGSKIPIATGTYNPTPTAGEHPEGAGVQTQFTYLDIGMDFTAALDEFANGVRLRSNVVQSSVAGQNTIAGVVEPLIRETSLKGAAYLAPGKPLRLGSIDIPGSTRHLDIEVVMEQQP